MKGSNENVELYMKLFTNVLEGGMRRAKEFDYYIALDEKQRKNALYAKMVRGMFDRLDNIVVSVLKK